jgi:hypothetical protein
MILNLKEGSPGYRILHKESKAEGKVSFDVKKALKEEEMKTGDDSLPKLLPRKGKQKKYFDNPEPNWGPKPRATGK